MVADEYVETLLQSDMVEITACTDLDLERAQAFASGHGIQLVAPLNELLGAGTVELLVILTPPESHRSVAETAITAGVAVFVEKPLARSGAEGAELLMSAKRQRVLVGAAPDTFLAPPARAAAAAIVDGAIGEPFAASAALLSAGPERWHPAPQGLYTSGMGPLRDMGPYYLSQLVYLLGPISSVHGATATTRAQRIIRAGPDAGQTFESVSFTHIEALLRTRAGTAVNLTASSDTQASTRPHLEIYGTDGTLCLPDPNFHHGPVQLRRRDDAEWRILPPVSDCSTEPVGRGMGVLDLARAVRTDAPPQASGDQALQVLRIMDAIELAAETDGQQIDIDVPRLY